MRDGEGAGGFGGGRSLVWPCVGSAELGAGAESAGTLQWRLRNKQTGERSSSGQDRQGRERTGTEKKWEVPPCSVAFLRIIHL